jgi:muramidase (phage lysozyme)
MGGKTSTSSQSVSIPPEVLARYNSVNARAEEVAKTPFQPYTDQFVAGLSPTQTAGIQNTNVASTQAQPYYNAATGLTLSGAQDVGALNQNQIGYYQNPYTQAVAAPTYAALQQQQGQERSQQQAQAIKSGAAFGERSGLQRAQLAGQQSLATAQALAPIYQQGYQQAVQTAQGQQGVVAADLARRMQAGQQVAGIGTAAQQAGLQGAQAQIAAGTVEQQTQQADLTARYQQFLQQRGYDFQTAQFLANIAMGTGSLSGSTTTTTQPQGFFSDERLKHDAHRIGETDDGLPIYSYKYNGDNKTQIGLMAQDVERRKPEAVGLAPASDGKMYKTVDYDKATRQNKDYGGGVMGDYDPSSMGGAVAPGLAGEGFADGGMPGMPNMGGMPGISSYVPAANLPIGKLITADPKLLQQNKAGLASAVETGKGISGLYDMGKSGIAWGKKQLAASGGLIVPRHGYATDGNVGDDEPTPYNYAETKSGEDPMKDVLSSGSKLVNRLPKPGGGGGGGSGPQSGASQLSSALGLGTAAMNFGSTAAEFLPEMAMMLLARGGRTPFAYGGVIPRKGYALPGRVEDVPADYSAEADLPSPNAQEAGLVVDQPRYKIAPQKKEEMEPHWQQFINRTYASEGGMDESGRPRYNIRQGGKETFDPETGHPGPGKPRGGESSAAGAGQFIHETWNRITGGAPMTEGYQDAATKELAMQDYKARTGRDLDADLKEQGLSPQILKTLSPTWTSFNKGLSPPNMVGRSERAPSSYSGKGAGEASLGDVVGEYLPQGTPTSANFWVPALAGLGSMLASRNPTLLGAVGEGLVGGVSGYQEQQKQQFAEAKDLRGMLEKQFIQGKIPNDPTTYGASAGKDGFWNVRTQTWMTADQVNNGFRNIAKERGINPSFLGIPELPSLPKPGIDKPSIDTSTTKPTVQTAGETAKPTTTEQTQPAEGKQVPVAQPTLPSMQQLRDEIRRGGDKAFSDAGLIGGDDPRPLEAQLAAKTKQLENMPPGSPQEDKIRREADQLRSEINEKWKNALEGPYNTLKQNFMENKKWAEGLSDTAVKSQKARANIEGMMEILNDFRTGALSKPLNEYAALIEGMGITVPQSATVNPTAFQAFLKDSMQQVFDDVRTIGGQIRVAELTGLKTANPEPDKTPGANRLILAQGLGSLNFAEKYYNDAYQEYKKNPARFDRSAFDAEWLKNNKNKAKAFVDEAYKDIAPRGDVPLKKGIFDPDTAKPGHAYVIEPGQGISLNGSAVTKPTKLYYLGVKKNPNTQRYEMNFSPTKPEGD